MEMPEKRTGSYYVFFFLFFEDYSSRCSMGQSQRDVWLLSQAQLARVLQPAVPLQGPPQCQPQARLGARL